MDITEPGALPYRYWIVENGRAEPADGGVIEETLVDIYVNGQELATMMCSPTDLEALAVGFLYTEGVIESISAVELVKLNVSRTVIDILLDRSNFSPPRRLVLTSGCGGGVTMQHITESYPPLESSFSTTTAIIVDRMRDLHGAAHLYSLVRGVHAAVIASSESILVSAEDVGRHNAVDKIAGKALQQSIDTRDKLLLTSGRISSEMLSKARRMDIPIVASRTAPTSTAVKLAEVWNICLVGYVRQGGMRVYTHPQRLALAPIPLYKQEES